MRYFLAFQVFCKQTYITLLKFIMKIVKYMGVERENENTNYGNYQFMVYLSGRQTP